MSGELAQHPWRCVWPTGVLTLAINEAAVIDFGADGRHRRRRITVLSLFQEAPLNCLISFSNIYLAIKERLERGKFYGYYSMKSGILQKGSAELLLLWK
jgi:hypothetical protein